MSQTRTLTGEEVLNHLEGAIKQSEIRLKDLETYHGDNPRWDQQKEQNQHDQCSRLKEIVTDFVKEQPGTTFNIQADEVVNRGGNPFTSEKVRQGLLAGLEDQLGNHITFDKDGRAVEMQREEPEQGRGTGPTVTPAPEPLPQIEREFTTAQLLPEIRDEIKIVNESIENNEKWLAKSGRIIEEDAARQAAEKAITNGISEAIKKERADLQEETRKLAVALDDHEQKGKQFSDVDRMDPNNAEYKAHVAESDRLKGVTNDLGDRMARNEVNAVRLENYLQKPEVQNRIEAYVEKCQSNNEVIRDAQNYTAELKEYRQDLKKVENTLANDPKKDRAYKLEAGTDPRSRNQIMKDQTFRQQIGTVQKQIDQTKAKDKGIER